jgi:hypothetical protein
LRIVLRIGNGYGLMESLRGVWACKVRGKVEGVGCGRGKFAECSRVRVLKVLGKFEG